MGWTLGEASLRQDTGGALVGDHSTLALAIITKRKRRKMDPDPFSSLVMSGVKREERRNLRIRVVLESGGKGLRVVTLNIVVKPLSKQ